MPRELNSYILDIQRVCKSAALIAQCAQGHLSQCIGEQV